VKSTTIASREKLITRLISLFRVLDVGRLKRIALIVVGDALVGGGFFDDRQGELLYATYKRTN